MATGTGAVGGGDGSEANGAGAVAIGLQQVSKGNGAVAIGDPNTAWGTGAVAIGANNKATGDGALATGNGNFASGQGAIAAGNKSVAKGASAIAMGDTASASADNAIAFGAGASATATNSVAIGSGSVATQADTVSVGAVGAERTIVNVAAGSLIAGSTNAVNGGQMNALGTSVAAGLGGGAAFNTQTGSLSAPNYSILGASYNNAGSAFAAVDTALSGLYSATLQLGQDLNKVRREERGGVAAVAAMPAAPMPSAAGRTSWVGNVAWFKDQTGIGFSFAHRLDVNRPIAITGAVSVAPGTSNFVGRGGLMGEF